MKKNIEKNSNKTIEEYIKIIEEIVSEKIYGGYHKNSTVEMMENIIKVLDVNYYAVKAKAYSDEYTFLNKCKEYQKEIDFISKEIKKVNRKIKIQDCVKASALWGSVATLTCAVLLGGSHHFWQSVEKSKDLNNDKVKIEKNVQNINQIAKFTGNAFTVSQKEEKKYLELFGIMIENPGESPVFGSLIYEIDDKLYETIHDYFDIEYKYGLDGQLISAENTMRDIHVVNGPRQKRVSWEVFEEIKNITGTQSAIKVNKFGKTSQEQLASHNNEITAYDVVVDNRTETEKLVDEAIRQLENNQEQGI